MPANSYAAPPLAWDDLMSAIAPRRGMSADELEQAIANVVDHYRAGRINAAQSAELIRILAAVRISAQVNQMVNDFFTPDDRGRLGRFI